MSRHIIVMVEDSRDDALLIRRRFKEYLDPSYQLVHCSSMEDALIYVKENKHDIELILLDLGLPDTKGGVDTFQHMKQHSAEIPVVILTSVEDHHLANQLVKEGAEDFVNKSLLYEKPKLLRDAIDFSITRHRLLANMSKQTMAALAEKDMVINWMGGGYSMQK